MFHEGLEVLVVVQQRVSIFDAAGRNHRVDRLANGHSLRSKHSVVLRSLNRDARSAKIDNNQRSQQLLGLIEILLFHEALENFNKNQIADRQRLRPERLSPSNQNHSEGGERATVLNRLQGRDSRIDAEVQSLQHAEQKKRGDDGQQREDRARLLAP